MDLKEIVQDAARKHTLALGRLNYDGHQGYKCPTDIYSAKINSGDLRVEFYEDRIYRCYYQTEVFINGTLVASGTNDLRMLPIDVAALFIPQLIIDLLDGVDSAAALKKYHQSDTITENDLRRAGLLGRLATFYGARH